MMLDKFQKNNLKNKITVSLIGFILTIFALIYFIVVPTINDIKTVSEEIEGQRIDLEKKYIKGNSLKLLTENLKKIEPKLNLLDQIFINKNRELEFITTIENEANNSQVSQKIDLSSPKTTENKEFQKNSLQLFTKGGFNQQLKYLMNLETLSYYINIKTLELSSSAGSRSTEPNVNNGSGTSISENESGGINLSIMADTYWK